MEIGHGSRRVPERTLTGRSGRGGQTIVVGSLTFRDPRSDE